jgi:hypothetical protein
LQGDVSKPGFSFSEQVLHFSCGTFFCKKIESEVVIGDFTGRNLFLLIKADGKIYRAASIGIGDNQYQKGVLEIDYDSLSSANDLEDTF